MGDFIDRDYLIEKFEDTGQPSLSEMAKGYDLGIKAALRVVKKAPAVNRWILCNEKLPEIDAEVLVTLYKPELSGYFRKIGRWLGDEWLINNLFGVSPERVVAWQPLPEAYEPPRED